MKRTITLLAASALLSLAMAGCKERAAQGPQSVIPASSEAEEIVISQAMLRPPLPGRTTAMATFVIENKTERDDRLIAVSSPIAQTVEIHTILTEGNVKRMRRLDNGIAVPAMGKAMLMQGGDHIMLFEASIAEGTKSVPMTLTFEQLGDVSITAMVNDGTMTDDHSGH